MAKKRTNLDDLFEEEKSPVQSQSFADMFEASQQSTEKKLEVGDKFEAEILSVGKEESFVATGTPIDAVIMNSDLIDRDKNMSFKKGDKIPVVVIRVTHDEIRVTQQGSKSAPVDIESLEDAFDMELPIEARVTEIVKGGFRVEIQKLKGFCPVSQMEFGHVDDQESYIGKKFEFLITQFEAKGRNIVVSRRKLLELKRAEFEGEWLNSHQPGDLLVGRVVRLESYGAFVELEGGIQGLVHISQIGFQRLGHAKEALHLGDSVQVKILKIEEEDSRLKIGLSIKEAGGATDPWVEIVQEYPVGKLFTGVIDKVAPYGLFVRIIPGVNGLLPKSKWRDSEDSKKYDNLKNGESVELRIDELKFEERKVSLGLPGGQTDESWREHSSASVSASESMGGAFAAAFAKANKKKK